MAYDLNPKFGCEERFEEEARRVSDFLWETSKGNLQDIPDNYVENLGYEFSDGSVSYLNLLNRVSLSQQTYEEFAEVVESLLHTYESDWPNTESIVEIPSHRLLHEIEAGEFDFSEEDWEFNFASPQGMSDKVELFLKKVISSVYLDGVSRVTDKEGNPPNESNSFLLSPDMNSFSGMFFDLSDKTNPKKFDFEIKPNSKGNYTIQY